MGPSLCNRDVWQLGTPPPVASRPPLKKNDNYFMNTNILDYPSKQGKHFLFQPRLPIDAATYFELAISDISWSSLKMSNFLNCSMNAFRLNSLSNWSEARLNNCMHMYYRVCLCYGVLQWISQCGWPASDHSPDEQIVCGAASETERPIEFLCLPFFLLPLSLTCMLAGPQGMNWASFLSLILCKLLWT